MSFRRGSFAAKIRELRCVAGQHSTSASAARIDSLADALDGVGEDFG